MMTYPGLDLAPKGNEKFSYCGLQFGIVTWLLAALRSFWRFILGLNYITACQMSLKFLTRWVSMLLGLAQVSWAIACVGVHRLFPLSPSISQCFSIHASPAIGFHTCFFFTTDVSAPIRSTLHLLVASFQAWDWLWYPMLWSQRRSMWCA